MRFETGIDLLRSGASMRITQAEELDREPASGVEKDSNAAREKFCREEAKDLLECVKVLEEARERETRKDDG